MFRNCVLVALAFAFVFALPVSPGQAVSPAAPNVSTGGVSNVSYSAAILNGSVDPHGQETNYVFQYGATRSYGSQTPLAPAGNGPKTTKVSQSVSGLQPLTTYHYRIVGSSPAGTTKGNDRTFTTPAIPLSLAIPVSPTRSSSEAPSRSRASYPGQGPAATRSSCRPIRTPTWAASRSSATRRLRIPPGTSHSRCSACSKTHSFVL